MMIDIIGLCDIDIFAYILNEKKYNFIANALEFHIFCMKPSTFTGKIEQLNLDLNRNEWSLLKLWHSSMGVWGIFALW